MIENSADELYAKLEPGSVNLILTDPPYGTGKAQTIHGKSYTDDPQTAEQNVVLLGQAAARLLAPDGVLAVFFDYRLVHKAHGILSDYLTPHGEIIWHYMLGGTAKKWWSNKHDTILLFDRGGNGYFDHDSDPNVPRLASRGENYPLTKPKKQDSVIEYTMSPTSRERVGYPTQKPLDVLRQIVGVHSRRGDLVIDPFMGSGSTLIAAKDMSCRYAGADINPDARQIALERLGQW